MQGAAMAIKVARVALEYGMLLWLIYFTVSLSRKMFGEVKKEMKRQHEPAVRQNEALLTVVEGPDMDAYLEFGEGQIYIGRREKNDFILTDTKASRLHAWIAYENHRHVLYDAQSTNGTYVNGEPVESLCLCSGDEIQIGTTVLLYEVI